jgi:hypothetical protein
MRTKAIATPAHDRELFLDLIGRARSLEPSIRGGAMFGCPAAFVGRRMAFCVYGTELGAKLPYSAADALLERGVVEPFQPYGKARMREWIKVTAPRESAATFEVIERAIVYARSLATPV